MKLPALLLLLLAPLAIFSQGGLDEPAETPEGLGQAVDTAEDPTTGAAEEVAEQEEHTEPAPEEAEEAIETEAAEEEAPAAEAGAGDEEQAPAAEAEPEEQLVTGPANITRRVWELTLTGDAEGFLPYYSDDFTLRFDAPSRTPFRLNTVGKEGYLAVLGDIAALGDLQYEIASVDEFNQAGATHVISVLDSRFVVHETGAVCEGEIFVDQTFSADGAQIVADVATYSSDYDWGCVIKDSAEEVLRKYIISGGAYRYLAEDVVVRRGFSAAADVDAEHSNSKAEHIAFNDGLKDKLETGAVKILSLSAGEYFATADIAFKSYTAGRSEKNFGTLYAWVNDEGLISSIRYSPGNWDEFILGKPIKDKDSKKDSKKKK